MRSDSHEDLANPISFVLSKKSHSSRSRATTGLENLHPRNHDAFHLSYASFATTCLFVCLFVCLKKANKFGCDSYRVFGHGAVQVFPPAPRLSFLSSGILWRIVSTGTSTTSTCKVGKEVFFAYVFCSRNSSHEIFLLPKL
jgi:hypothetical protein